MLLKFTRKNDLFITVVLLFFSFFSSPMSFEPKILEFLITSLTTRSHLYAYAIVYLSRLFDED